MNVTVAGRPIAGRPIARPLFDYIITREHGHSPNVRVRANTLITSMALYRLCFLTSCKRDIREIFSPHSVRCIYVWAYAKPVCVLFASSSTGIVFNQSTCSITGNRQSTIDPNMH